MLDSIDIAKFLASFVLLLIILYALYYYFHNFSSKLPMQGKEIKIKEMRMLSKGRYLFLVEVKNKILLLASDENGMKILQEWENSG